MWGITRQYVNTNTYILNPLRSPCEYFYKSSRDFEKDEAGKPRKKMIQEWSFCNRWLREQADLPPKRRNMLIYCTLQPSELALVLAQVKRFEGVMNSGKVRLEVISKVDEKLGTIELSVEDSKETST